MSSDIAIQVENLSKCYQIYDQPRDRLKQFVFPHLQRLVAQSPKHYFREFWALKDVSFEIRKGESVGILGRNGSGKSTLLQMITGTLTPTAGSIQTSGRISALLELGAGFNPEFSGRENVFLNLALHGFREEEILEKFNAVATFADIGDFIDRPLKTYSSGMHARLAFAAAIHTEPEVLIVDEILAVGDAPFQQKCINRLYRMIDQGISVLMVSHDAYQIRSICTRALLLQRGKQVLFDKSDKVIDAYIASNTEPPANPASIQEQQDKVDSTTKAVDAPQLAPALLVSIHNPILIAYGMHGVIELKSLCPIELEFEYRLHGAFEDNLSFVVNIYREDGVYIFGTTTKMQGLPAFAPASQGRVRVHFPSLPLVSGKYKFRVAVNDGRGLNILAEAVPVCQVSVSDDFKAVGIVDIPHAWSHEVMQSRKLNENLPSHN
ncbi:MAG: ABC transporter ATP-binding protein [Rhodoferax sp.]|nr:ABC transporter ATP-binding protein [Rhodoferax sp.]